VESHPLERWSQFAGCIVASATLGYLLALFANVYFAEMHIISTDYQLRPGLTLSQVAMDVLLTCNIFSLISGLMVGAIALATVQMHKSQWSKAHTKAVIWLAVVCCLIVNIGVWVVAAQYYVQIMHRLT